MARYTTAYSSFVDRLVEVETLRNFAFQKEKLDPVSMRHEINALCRGSIVLLSSHLEAYIKELGELALESLYKKAVPRNKLSSKFYYHISKNILEELKDTTDPEKIGDKIFEFLEKDHIFWSKNGIFPESIPSERFNKGFSNPAFDKIKAYFNRFGYHEYKKDLESRLQAKFQPTMNMVDHLVDIRNKIAHGNPTATKTPSEVKDIVSIIKLYCTETDDVFATWWKATYCAIR